ncbi:hypothetical protein GUJ93_ZPchr0003g17005 [Zizania palustris]|uniref:Uncharacterized protein n=1 Tax=Zizania palustris TaxID=103762 RepID=A0A8J5V7T0_ZIZPA|nr:hypothetical protein GUJ93_ZPchr0003g17005 [Zizania palustris]
MESKADKLHDEPELPHRPPSAAGGGGADYEAQDEKEEEAEVTLGFLEKPKREGLLLRHLFPSKAGCIPVPAWLDSVNLPSGNSNCCGFCCEPLQFVLQVRALCMVEIDAPIEDNAAAFHRTLFMFMCPSMVWLLRDQHDQWKHRQGNPCRSVKVSWCHLPLVMPLLNCKRAHYCSEKRQALHWRSGHKNDDVQLINSSETSSSVQPAIGKVPASKS